MNKKIFKRLLIATGMISPFVMVTPILLTSCNDTNQSGGDQTQTDGNGITLVTFNSLLKEAKSFINPENNVFWLNISESNAFYYDENNKPTTFGKFYEEILKNTSIDFLTNKGYSEIDYHNEGLTKEENISIYKKIITNKDDPLIKLLNDLKLNNFKLENINGTVNSNENINDNLGVSILGSEIKLDNLIDTNKVDVNSYIKLVNNEFINSNDTNHLYKLYNYEFVYSIKPKDNYYWKGVESKNNKNKQALEIRVSDYINDILFIDNLDDFKLDEKNIVNFTGNAIDLTLGKDTFQNIATVDEFVAQIKKSLGKFETITSRNLVSISPTNETNLENVFEIFLKVENDSNSTKISGTSSSDGKSLFLNLNNINIHNLNEAFKKNRVKVNAEVNIDNTNKNKVVATINIKLNELENSRTYFSWLLKDEMGITSYSNANIVFTFNWTFKQTN